MLKLGEKIISDIYLGDKKIAKAFLGDKLVYQAGEPVFLDYVIFDGNSWIDTLFKPNPHTTRTVLDCMLLDNTSTGGQGIFGSRPALTSSINSMNIWFNTSDAPKKLRFDCTGDYLTFNTDIVDITQRLLIDCLDNNATVNGVTYSANIDKSNTTYINYSMYLGNFNNVGKPYTKGCKMNVYGFTIYDNGVLFQDLRPAIDPKGTVCMYDMVTKKYFYNQGTGTLTAGNIINFVDYIEFDGASYIDTGISSLSTWEIGAIGGETSYLRFLIANGGAGAQLFGYHSSGYWCIGAPTEFHFNTPFTQYIDCTVTFSNGLVTATVGEQTLTRTGNTLSDNYFLGGWKGSNSYWFKGKVYYCRNYNSERMLIQDLRPCIIASQACFYDMVTGKVFTNAGTGTLKAGGEINLASFTIVGTATIDNGIISNLNETSYITTKTNYGLPTASRWSIIFPTIKVNEFSKYFWGTDAERSGIVLAVNSEGKIVVYISSNGAQWDIASGINNLYSNLQFSKGEDVNIRLDFTGSKYVLYILKDNAWQEQTSVTSSLKVGYFEHFRIGQWASYYRFDSTMDLKTFIVVADGKVTSSLKQRRIL